MSELPANYANTRAEIAKALQQLVDAQVLKQHMTDPVRIVTVNHYLGELQTIIKCLQDHP